MNAQLEHSARALHQIAVRCQVAGPQSADRISGPSGRWTGLERSVIVGYFEDGPNLVTLAMNGWGEGEPAWWLNLQAHPDVRVDLQDGPRLAIGRAACGEERDRLWSRWREIDKNLDAYAARRSVETAVVILEPRS